MKRPKWLDKGPIYSEEADRWMRARVRAIEEKGGNKTTLSREEVDTYAQPSITTVYIGLFMGISKPSDYPEGTVARNGDTWIILRKRDRDEWTRAIGTGEMK